MKKLESRPIPGKPWEYSFFVEVEMKDNDEFNNFINTLKQRSLHNYGVEVSSNDKILTLSSCYDNKKRMVLHAKLISK